MTARLPKGREAASPFREAVFFSEWSEYKE
jgi:hypothetical protein